ncbi:MAG: PadR family transcriptional regulator [Anaerolineales bacterium]|nr:PadR family transcriptional regulator [Anaerolineales bacterium]
MTNAELAILSLVSENPHYGYEIEQIIELRGMRDWTEIGFSSIYYLLKKLEKKGYIRSQLDSQTGLGPARKMYAMTSKGKSAWREATLKALSEPQQTYPLIQMGLAGIPGLSRADVKAALIRYKQNLVQREAYVIARRESQRPLPSHVEWMFGYSLAVIQAEIQVTQKILDEMDRKDE